MSKHMYRRWDQPTSIEAAESIKPTAKTLRKDVLDYAEMRATDGFTDFEMNAYFESVSSTYRSRRAELVELGYIKDKGETKRGPNGRQYKVWIHHGYYNGEA